MDSRDITEKPDLGKGFLEHMYEMQRNLLNHYVGIEGLPKYPINVNTKPSQTLLKDFTGRVIEELAECFEAYYLVRSLTIENNLWFGFGEDVTSDSPKSDNSPYEAMLNHLQNVGEEMADALHFYIELLIYANIQPEDIKNWVNKFASGLAKDVDKSDILTLLMGVGNNVIHENYSLQSLKAQSHNRVNLLNPIFNGQFEYGSDLDYVRCCSVYSGTLTNTLKMLFWDVTFHLNISRNFLKNKPWKQSEVMTSEEKYQSELIIGFIKLMGTLTIMGCDPKLVYFLYFKKNHVNQFRIKSNY